MNTYSIGGVGFIPDACELYKDGAYQHLQPQVRSVLLCLVEHANEVVSKEVLLKEAWNGRPATDECLTRCISILRACLSDQSDKHLIETIHKVGYRLHCDPHGACDKPCIPDNKPVADTGFKRPIPAVSLTLVMAVILLFLLIII